MDGVPVAMLRQLAQQSLHHNEPEQAVFYASICYNKTAAAANAAVAEEEEQLSIEELMAQANVENGKKVAKKCVSCHSFDQGGAHKIGPNLYAIMGAPKAAKDGYAYSGALKAVGGVWDNESMFAFLKKPSKAVPGTKMSFAGLRKPEDIADVMLYLKENS